MLYEVITLHQRLQGNIVGKQSSQVGLEVRHQQCSRHTLPLSPLAIRVPAHNAAVTPNPSLNHAAPDLV